MNRGYMKLRVWQDAADLYAMTCKVFQAFPYELKRVSSNHIASVDSVHRNIAEGYGRKSIKEYLRFLDIALGSLGESVSGLHVYRNAAQVSEDQFECCDQLSHKIENGLRRLIQSLQKKARTSTWEDSFVLRESNALYGTEEEQR